MDELDAWLAQELPISVEGMMRSISATGLTRRRPAFGQVVTPRPGSVVASPVFGDYDPEPDYFFHWLRDSALVMDALRELVAAGIEVERGHACLADFVRFSLALSEAVPYHPKSATRPSHRRYLRPAPEFRELDSDRRLAESRVNPDGSLDILRWARPQHDGPALRALAMMRYWPLCPASDPATKDLLRRLIRQDLGFVARHWREPSYDIWEEHPGHHYYTRLLHLAALVHGGPWLRATGEDVEAISLGSAIDGLAEALDGHWCENRGIYLARMDGGALVPDKEPDISVVLGALHADLPDGPHSVLDPRTRATLAAVEATFRRAFAINRQPGRSGAPALGRYPGDRYFGGGAYYMATLGAAEFYARLAERVAAHPAAGRDAHDLLGRCDACLETVMGFTPPSGELSEQFDRDTGAQTSARHLAWSYAAFITSWRSRLRARLALLPGQPGQRGPVAPEVPFDHRGEPEET